jgi:serine/threonine protein kinase/Tfp pilus assembly protein PilF
MPADLQRARELFLHAVGKLPPEQWDAYLAGACGPDAELERHVLHMLQVHREAGSFLERPAAVVAATDAYTPSPEDEAPAAAPAATETVGTTIGPYKLIQAIGEGGMGAVWMAQQTEPVKRLVAVKVIKPGMDSKQVLARFAAERQALALMDHPHIARVLDAGTTAGRPFFVMELVKGVPITHYCDEHRLTPRQRLELFVPVCQAVQHAHQKGIIHRDLKPSNVLVAQYDGRPVPKVIDFGIAKATGQQLTEHTLVTGFGAVVGTLEYMSPEQAELNQLDIDTRSDIYSLGVLLYELLTGSTPLEKKRLKQAALLEVLRVIREVEPPRPSTRLSTTDELPSVAANRGLDPRKLSGVVRGELDWIVMKALDKDRDRRYETANAFAADVQRYLADEPVLACPPSAGYRLQKFARRHKAALALAVLLLSFLVILGSVVGWALRDRAAREEEIARESARKHALTEQGIRQALDRAGKIRGELHAVLKKPGGVQELLNRPDRWELFIKMEQAELAQARRSAERAESPIAAELSDAMVAQEEQVAADEADRLLAQHLEHIRLDRDTWIERSFDLRKSAAAYDKALAGFGVHTEDPAQVAARLRASPIQSQLVAVLDDWAYAAFFVLKDDRLVDRLLEVARAAAPDPAWGDRVRQRKLWRDPEALGKLVGEAPVASLSPETLALIGSLLPRDSAQAESWWRRAQAEHPADFWLNFDLATALRNTNPAEAIGFYRAALAIRPESSAVYNNLGNLLRREKKVAEAIGAYHKAIKLDPKLAFAYNGLGNALRELQKLPEALAAYHKAIELDPEFALAYSNLSMVLRDQKQLPEAIDACRKAIKLDPKLALAYNNLGNALRDQKNLPEAIDAFNKAIELDPHFAVAYINLGHSLREQQRLPEAIDAFNKALQSDPHFAPTYNSLGLVFREQKQLPEAIDAFNKAIKLDPALAEAHYNLGLCLGTQGKFVEALQALKKGHELGSTKPGWPESNGRFIKVAEQAVALDARLQEVSNGQAKPKDGAEAVALARFCQNFKKHYTSAVRFYTDAFAAEPKLADDLTAAYRYGAARAAALAGCGQGEDAGKLDDQQRARLRQQALDWLGADLAAWQKRLGNQPDKARPTVRYVIGHWQQDSDLAGVRGEALAKLPEAERQAWQQLWDDAAALLRRAAEKSSADKK